MAEIANKLLGLKISGQEVWVFSILVYAYADPGLNYLQSQSFLLKSDWIVFLIQGPCWIKEIWLVMLYFVFPDHSLSHSLSQLLSKR